MDFLKRIFGRHWYLFVAAFMLVVFFGNAMGRDNGHLDVYQGGSSTYTVDPETEKPVDMDTFLYVNDEIAFQMEVMEGWQKVVKDGYDTFIHSASASSIQVQVLSYYPMVNNATMESLSGTYGAMGYEVTEFNFLANNCYYLIYRSNGASGVTDYIEEVIWDREHVVKVVVTFNDLNYEKLKDMVWYCLDSIQWEYESPIPEGAYLVYQMYGDFEYAVPEGWAVGSTDESFYAYDEGTSSTLTVNVLEDTSSISDISEVEYANFLANGKSDFLLSRFEQSGDLIYAEAVYDNNGVQTSVMQYYMANGAHHYILTYEFPTGIGGGMAQACMDALSVTRVFEAVDEPEPADAGAAVGAVPQGAPGAGTESQQKEAGGVAEMPTEGTGTAGTDTGNQDGSVQTFSDALIDVSGMPREKADAIAACWEEAKAGVPVYAEAYKESDTSLVIYVQDADGVDYFIYVQKDGTLQEIHVNTEDGPLVYG